MGCNCGGANAGKTNTIVGYAVVDDVQLANTPQLIPDSDKYNTIDEAMQNRGDRLVVAIMRQI